MSVQSDKTSGLRTAPGNTGTAREELVRKDKKEWQQAEESGVSGDECPSWREGVTESSALRNPIRPKK